ncbi:hypothetical protein BJ878DRAFT_575983 [Calycina marina]|uniref:Berberine/berberine-like domain-containing protein n=1 Tax=Calycina marina TaxID=1763456 RepID=A0A9P8CEJ8_9HELO|nr:hypothetical protein BJ878DRAFT_575983 [Calycina marina]
MKIPGFSLYLIAVATFTDSLLIPSDCISIPPIFSTVRTATRGELTGGCNAGAPMEAQVLIATMAISNSAAFMEAFYQMSDIAAQEMSCSFRSPVHVQAKELGVWKEYFYLNYANNLQKPTRGYGEENVEMLKNISRKYDPWKTSQKAVVGGFKLDE